MKFIVSFVPNIQVWPHPETETVLIPIYLDSLRDFRILEKAAQSTKKFAIIAYRYYIISDGVFPYSLLPYDLPNSSANLRVLMGLQDLLTKLNPFAPRTPYPPVVASLTDVSKEGTFLK